MKRMIGMKTIVMGAVCAFVCGVAQALPHYGDPNQPYDKMPDTLVTPHIPWATPLAGGKLKALVVAPYHMTREVCELKERLDMDVTVIMTAGFNERAHAYYEGEIATPIIHREADLVVDKIMKERLLDRAKKYDVIFLGKVSWELFTAAEKKCIYERVKDGAGLVWISPNRVENKAYSKKLVETPDPMFDELIGCGALGDRALPAAVTRGIPMEIFQIEKLYDDRAKMYADKPFTHQNRTQMKTTPAWIGGAKVGKGRTVAIDWDDAVLTYGGNYDSIVAPVLQSIGFKFDYTIWDYSFMLAARAILVATGRDGATKVSLEIPKEIVRGAKDVAAKIDIHSPTPTQNSNFSSDFFIRPRTKFWDDLNLEKFRCPATAASFASLAAGEYVAGVRLLDKDGKVVDFASKTFTVKGDLEITDLKTDKEKYAVGDKIVGTFALSRALKPDEKIEVTAVDTWGRLVAEQKVGQESRSTKDGSLFTFSIPVVDPLCRLWDLYVTVKDGAGQVAKATMWTTIPNWVFDDYTAMLIFCPMPGGNGWKGDINTQLMRKWGINAAYSGFFLHGGWHEAELNERAHLYTVAYTSHEGELENQPDLVRAGIANTNLDIAARIEMCDEIVRTGGAPLDEKKWTYKQSGVSAWHFNRQMRVYREIARFGTPYCSTTGENYLSGEFGGGGPQGAENSGFGPKTTKLFQEWCKKEYANDLAALNKEWNTSFKSWDEVKGVMLADAAEDNQMPRWVDFRFFMRSEMWSGFFNAYDRMISTADPRMHSGFGGHGNHDYTKYRGRSNTSGKLYVSQKDNWEWQDAFDCEMRQSCAKDNGWWLGSQSNIRWTSDLNNEISRKRLPWAMLFMDLQGTDFENGIAGESLGGMSWITPDYSDALPFFKEMMGEVLKLERGIGKLFINAKRCRSKVAIDWSPRNHYISRLLMGRQPRGFSGTWLYNCSILDGGPNDALGLMNSIRMRPSVVGPDDVVSGLAKDGFKALWLPYNKGMSLAEAAAIRKFVTEGGVVFADNEPATYSEHGRPLAKEEYRLKDLFPDFSKPTKTQVGKGYAVYLAGALNCYPDRMLEGNFKGADIVATLLDKLAGERPPVEMTDEQGLAVRNVRMVEHDRAGTRLVGFLRQHVGDVKNDTKSYFLDFRGEYDVYDLVKGQYLGRHGHLKYDIDHYAAMLALCPVKTVSAELKASDATAILPTWLGGSKSAQRGGKIALKLDVDFKGSWSAKAKPADAWHLTVFGPDGKELEYYRDNYIVEGDSFTLTLPIALNAAKGAYKAEMVSALTGVKAETTFEVK